MEKEPSKVTPKRVLVTGACGFIGHHLVKYLKHTVGAEVYGYDNMSRAAINDGVFDDDTGNLIRGDIRDFSLLEEKVSEIQPDVVFHLAAESHVDQSIDSPMDSFEINSIGSHHVAESCLIHGAKLVYCSTDEVYGDRSTPAKETDTYRPSSPYSAGKVAGEAIVMAYRRTYGLKCAITRACNAFGTGQLDEKLIPKAIRLGKSGNDFPLHDGGSQTRQWVHVDDFCQILHAASLRANSVMSDNFIFNIAGPETFTVKETVEMIYSQLKLNGYNVGNIVDSDPRPGQDMAYAVDGSLTEALLWGAKPSIRLSESIETLIASY